MADGPRAIGPLDGRANIGGGGCIPSELDVVSIGASTIANGTAGTLRARVAVGPYDLDLDVFRLRLPPCILLATSAVAVGGGGPVDIFSEIFSLSVYL